MLHLASITQELQYGAKKKTTSSWAVDEKTKDRFSGALTHAIIRRQTRESCMATVDNQYTQSSRNKNQKKTAVVDGRREGGQSRRLERNDGT